MDFIDLPILMMSLVLVISILTSLVSTRVGIPLILIFLCLGVVVGFSSFDVLSEIRHPRLMFGLGAIALALILFDSGFHTSMKMYRQASLPAILLATLGVVLTAVLMAPMARYTLHVGWVSAFLLVAMISSTDSAAVFFLLRSKGLYLREKVKATLEVESGANDPMAIFLTISCMLILSRPEIIQTTDYLALVPMFGAQLVIGALGGLVLARGIIWLVNQIKLEPALYPIFVLGLALLGFACVDALGGSGFLAVYIAGVIVGNNKIQAYTQISKFQQTTTWLCQIVMFVSLGLFVTWEGLISVWKPALVLAILLMFFARPMMIWGILSFFSSYTRHEKNFISFVGLRGATSVLLALLPIIYELPEGEFFFNIIFVMVLLSLLIQGFFIPVIARLCGVVVPRLYQEPVKMEIDLPGLTDSSLIMYELGEKTPAVLGEKIPRWARPTLVVRNGLTYSSVKQLMVGDRIYVVSPSTRRQGLLDRLFGGGEAAEVLDAFGDFPLAASTTFAELERMYGVQVSQGVKDRTIADVMAAAFGDMELGDRLSVDAIELVVRTIENGVITTVGVDLDPQRRRSFYAKTKEIQTV